jgi:prolyl-tRNA editing enzyme YbaK/EbsC (Cys-tRNA(Pro) deacylase)
VQEIAEQANVDGMSFSKTVMAIADTKLAMVAMPPFGNLFDIPMYIADALIKQDIISFNAGYQHEHTPQGKRRH